METIKRQKGLRMAGWSSVNLWAHCAGCTLVLSVTCTAPLQAWYVACGAIQVLYAFDLSVVGVLQASSYGGGSTAEGKPDLQCGRETRAGQVQPRGTNKTREQDSRAVPTAGHEEDKGAGLMDRRRV